MVLKVITSKLLERLFLKYNDHAVGTELSQGMKETFPWVDFCSRE